MGIWNTLEIKPTARRIKKNAVYKKFAEPKVSWGWIGLNWITSWVKFNKFRLSLTIDLIKALLYSTSQVLACVQYMRDLFNDSVCTLLNNITPDERQM